MTIAREDKQSGMAPAAKRKPQPRRRWLPVALVAVVALLLGARLWMALAFGMTSVNEESLGESIMVMLAFAPYLVVGLVLIARRPEHRLAWVVTAVGVLTSVGVLAESYAMLALAERADAGLPGGVVAAWIHNWYWYPLLGLMFVFVPLLFPTGRPLSPRWRWLYYAATTVLVAVTVTAWVKPTLTDGNLRNPRYVVDNPIGIAAVGDIEKSTFGSVLFGALLILILCAVTSLVVRFRRSRGLERQQMKLFVFAGCVMVLLPVAEEVGVDRFLPDTNIFFSISVALPPVAIGVAVLRYRLYDIDRLISRTVTYAVLTVVLVGLYVSGVAAITAVTAPAAGDSPIAVAAATLLAAAAFRPARRRIQAIVDRRFNRARYDAAKTVDDYRTHLRDELDLTAITAGLAETVTRTVEPARCAVWLRPEATKWPT